jgi:integrase
MALFKRNRTWWTDFSVNGVRYRVSLDVTDWREAKEKEKEKISEAKQGKIAPTGRSSWARLGFAEASTRYLAERKGQVSPATSRTEADRVKPLDAFFGTMRLNRITADDIHAFQAKGTAEGKHPRYLNHQVKLLRTVLRRAKLYVPDAKLLTVPKPSKGRVLESDDKLRLFQVASSKPEWKVAYCAALLTANCSLRPCEIRSLRWCDLNSEERVLFIPTSKTAGGIREVPLNGEAWSAIAAMRQRAAFLGTYAPTNFIFHRLWPKVDGSRPMRGWRSAWRSLRKAAGLPNFRYYTLRAQCITEMLEKGVPEGVIREVVGHVDPDMLRWYSDVRKAARRAAVEMISGASVAGYVTNSDTKALTAPTRVL